MTLSDWLKQAQAQLEGSGIATARLDCLVLLADALERDKSWLLSHAEYALQGPDLKMLNTKVAQRAKHTPLAYIRGHAEFYGREFAVNAHTLVPRPETEAMIDVLKDLVSRHPEQSEGSSPGSNDRSFAYAQDDENITLADIGTGSGAIAITAKLELPQTHVIATDIDKNCLKTAEHNARSLGVDITLLHGFLLQPLRDSSLVTRDSIILANLPYVPDNFQINTAATHEPRRALFGGPDGLDLYRQLFRQANSLATKPVCILTESLPPQHEMLAEIAKAAGYQLQQTNDFIQLFVAESRM
ncbi:MAG TPA: HemK/PrmC family methyltransferase [Candidatus Saccharimonadales bacterium]|nr:HemK/PrmC family methyltransferase [Candidatus Saccharimonadales bacterium]